MSFDLLTLGIIGLTVLVSIKGFNDSSFFNRYKFNPIAVEKARQWDRMFTSGFLHADFNHLLFNMLTLFFFAPVSIAAFGEVGFVILYVAAILLGSAFSLWENRGNAYYNAIGASGGVSGVLFAAILLNPTSMLYLFFAIPIPAWVVGIGYLGYSIYGMRKRIDNIGHAAHMGGALAGIIPTLVLYPNLFYGEYRMYTILILIPVLVLGFLMFKEKAK